MGRAEHMKIAARVVVALVAALAGLSHMNNVIMDYAADPLFDRKEAIRLLRLALSIDDSDPEILAFACLIPAPTVGDYECGIELADRAVALNSNSFFAWNGRGVVYQLAGLPEEAVRSFEQAVRVSPIDPVLYLAFAAMGMALIELGRFDEAIVAGKKAQRRNPSHGAVYRCLASAFAHLGRDAEAREAVTHFEVLELLTEHALLDVRLETGRTHQIRVHLQAIELPVSGDRTYGVRGDLGLTRQFLHAHRLRFMHPRSGEEVALEAPLPAELEAALAHARSL